MIWDEFLRHFRLCDEEDSGLSDEEQERKGPKNRRSGKDQKIAQSTHENGYIKPKKLFGEIQNSFLIQLLFKVDFALYQLYSDNLLGNRCTAFGTPGKNKTYWKSRHET